jgi:hypothetical protein
VSALFGSKAPSVQVRAEAQPGTQDVEQRSRSAISSQPNLVSGGGQGRQRPLQRTCGRALSANRRPLRGWVGGGAWLLVGVRAAHVSAIGHNRASRPAAAAPLAYFVWPVYAPTSAPPEAGSNSTAPDSRAPRVAPSHLKLGPKPKRRHRLGGRWLLLRAAVVLVVLVLSWWGYPLG